MAFLNCLPGLSALALCEANDSVMEGVGQLKHLNSLSIRCECRGTITDKGIKACAQLGQVRSLSIVNGWYISDSGMALLGSLGMVEELECKSFPE